MVHVALDLALEVQQRAVEVRGDLRHGPHEPRGLAACVVNQTSHGAVKVRFLLCAASEPGGPPEHLRDILANFEFTKTSGRSGTRAVSPPAVEMRWKTDRRDTEYVTASVAARRNGAPVSTSMPASSSLLESSAS